MYFIPCTTKQMKWFFSSLNTEQVHRKFPFCSKNSLNLSTEWYSFKLVGKSFHKTLPLNLNEFIPYFWGLRSEIMRGTLLLSEYEICFAHENFDRFIYFNGYESQMPLMNLRSMYYLRLKGSHIWSCNYLTRFARFYIVFFPPITYIFLRKTSTSVDIR